MKRIQVRPDSRNRICLTKVLKNMPPSFYVYKEEDRIILEPVMEIPAHEAWLFKPENKHILEKVIKGLKQKGTISVDSYFEDLENNS